MASKDLITKIILKGKTDASLQKAFETAGKYSDTYIDKLKSVGKLASTAFKVVGTAAVAGATAASKAAIDYESAFAGVRKTVEETDTTKYADLSDGIRDLAKNTPATAAEIAGVAEAAGQLGIKADDILKFSKTMIDLGESTNLTSDEAATSIAKMFNVTGTSMDNVDRFGSTLVALGNNAATTESDILNMATRIASSATQVGMSEQELLALATSLSSVGLEAEGGGTAISTVMSNIDKDVALGAQSLAEYAERMGTTTEKAKAGWEKQQKALGVWAKTAGMSVSEFSDLWQTDAYGAMQKLINGMGTTKDEGGNLNLLLEDLGITGIRTSDTMKRLSNASGLMSEMTDLANKSWSDNAALTKEANTRYATTASKIQMAKNKFYDLGIEIGNKLLPYINKFLDKLGEINFDAVASKIGGFIDWLARNAKTIGLVASMIAGAFVGIKIAGLVKGIMTVIQIVSALIKSFGLVKVILTTLGGPVTIVIAVIGALVAGFIYLWNTSEGFRNFWIGLWEKIKSAASAVGGWLKNFFTVTIPNAFNATVTFFQQLPGKIGTWLTGVWQKITTWGSNMWAKAKEIGSNFVTGVVNFFNKLPYYIGYAIGFVIGKIIQFGQKLWNFATVTVPQFIGKVVAWFCQLPGRIWTWLVNAAQKVVAWGSRIISVGRQKVSQFVSAAVSFFAQLPGRIWTWLVNAAQKVVAWGTQLVAKGKKAASDLLNAIVNKVKEIPGKMLSCGKNIVEGLWNGIKNAKKWLTDKIKGFASGIVDGIKGALGINSPSVVMEKLFKWVPVGAGNGIINNAKYAVNAVKAMGGKVTAAASKINPTIAAGVQKFGTGGTVTSPRLAVVGDKAETIVPHGNTPRNRSLLAEAARGVGGKASGGNTLSFTFAPVISGGNVEANRAMIREEEERFERQMEAWLAKNRRLAFA